DHVADRIPLEPHRNLGEAKGPRLAAQGDVELGLLDLAGLEYPVEFGLELGSGLPSQHLEHRAAHDFVPAKPGRADLALTVPDLDPVVPIDHVEPQGQAVDDEGGEPALLVDLP